MQPATKHCPRCNATKETDAFPRDAAKKGGRHVYCTACKKAAHQVWYAKNLEARRKKAREWNQAHKAQVYAYRDAWMARNIERARAGNRAHYRGNTEMYLARGQVRRQLVRRWMPWADKEAIRAIYAQARALRSRGFACEVDHIVPLRSHLVCGLHVQANLRIVAKDENRTKGNRTWPDMPAA